MPNFSSIWIWMGRLEHSKTRTSGRLKYFTIRTTQWIMRLQLLRLIHKLQTIYSLSSWAHSSCSNSRLAVQTTIRPPPPKCSYLNCSGRILQPQLQIKLQRHYQQCSITILAILQIPPCMAKDSSMHSSYWHNLLNPRRWRPVYQ